MAGFRESDVEAATLERLGRLGYAVLQGPDIAPGEPAPERTDYGQVLLEWRLRDALTRLNPTLPAEASKTPFANFPTPKVPRAKQATVHPPPAVDRVTVEPVWA